MKTDDPSTLVARVGACIRVHGLLPSARKGAGPEPVVVGVDVTNEGSDGAGLSEPMRRQVETRSGRKVQEHLVDGGYLRTEDLERAHGENVNADVRCHRGLASLPVRGLKKVRCVVLWSALAYNVMHFGAALLT